MYPLGVHMFLIVFPWECFLSVLVILHEACSLACHLLLSDVPKCLAAVPLLLFVFMCC